MRQFQAASAAGVDLTNQSIGLRCCPFFHMLLDIYTTDQGLAFRHLHQSRHAVLVSIGGLVTKSADHTLFAHR